MTLPYRSPSNGYDFQFSIIKRPHLIRSLRHAISTVVYRAIVNLLDESSPVLETPFG
jgi:hypothetical protein